MFDPHRTRRSDYRYYTRKGQVLQASRVNVNPTIDQRLVPIYKKYLLKNNLVNLNSQSQNPIKPLGIAMQQTSTADLTFYPFNQFFLRVEETFPIIDDAGSGHRALLLFQQKTDGTFRLYTRAFTGRYNTTIRNNVKCYYKLIDISSISAFMSYPKSLYHTSPSPENVFFTIVKLDTDDTETIIAPPVPIEL